MSIILSVFGTAFYLLGLVSYIIVSGTTRGHWLEKKKKPLKFLIFLLWPIFFTRDIYKEVKKK